MKRLAACCLLTLAIVGPVCAQQRPSVDTCSNGTFPVTSAPAPMVINFRINHADINASYGNNKVTIVHMDRIFSDSTLTARIDSVNVFSYASPDGRYARNLTLASKRAIAVKRYLCGNYPHLNTRRIHPRPQGENWQGLRDLILSDEHLPSRDKVIRIIDSTPNNVRCKLLLKRLGGGHPYRYIARHILPQLRNASVCVVYLRAPLPPMNETAAKGAGLAHATENKDKNMTGNAGYNENGSAVFVDGKHAYPDFFPLPFQPVTHTVRRPLLAVKTNLLFDLGMAPNIEVEIPIGNRWSVNAEWMFPWWLFKGDKYCFQILSGGLEGRYWLGNRERRRVLTGHFFGFYAGGGKYDLQWDKNGYQGEFYIASGISYGYALPIARNLNLEMSIGIGLMKTNYEHYHMLDNYNTLLWQNNGRYSWLGPTKAKVSLVWMLNRKVKVTQKGGVR